MKDDGGGEQKIEARLHQFRMSDKDLDSIDTELNIARADKEFPGTENESM